MRIARNEKDYDNTVINLISLYAMIITGTFHNKSTEEALAEKLNIKGNQKLEIGAENGKAVYYAGYSSIIKLRI